MWTSLKVQYQPFSQGPTMSFVQATSTYVLEQELHEANTGLATMWCCCWHTPSDQSMNFTWVFGYQFVASLIDHPFSPLVFFTYIEKQTKVHCVYNARKSSYQPRFTWEKKELLWHGYTPSQRKDMCPFLDEGLSYLITALESPWSSIYRLIRFCALCIHMLIIISNMGSSMFSNVFLNIASQYIAFPKSFPN